MRGIAPYTRLAWLTRCHRYSSENFPKLLKLADALAEIGERHDATAGQVALAWVLAQGDDVIPIPGTKKEKVSRHAYFDLACCVSV